MTLFGNTSEKSNTTSLFGNTSTTMQFGNFGFNFTSSNKNSSPQAPPVETPAIVESNETKENTVIAENSESKEMSVVVENNEIKEIPDNVESNEIAETPTIIITNENNEGPAVIIESKEIENEKEQDIVEENTEKEKISEENIMATNIEQEIQNIEEETTEEKEEKEENLEPNIKQEENLSEAIDKNEELPLNISEAQNSEIEVSMSSTLYDVSEPYNSPVKNVEDKEKLSSKSKNIFYTDDIQDIKDGKLLSLKFNQFVRSCDDILIGVNNIEFPLKEISSIHINEKSKDSIVDIKNEIRSILIDSNASILTFNNETLSKSIEMLNLKAYHLKKSKSISELEMITLKDFAKINLNNKKSALQESIEKYKNSINSDSIIIEENNEKLKNENMDENVTEDKCIDEKTIKTSKVADIVSTINNNINTYQQSTEPTVKKEEGCISQHIVDKMTKEFTMKEINNNTTQILEKGERIKCLKLSPALDENLTNEQLLSLYIKSLRPVKRPDIKTGYERNYSKSPTDSTDRDSSLKSNGRSVSSSIISSSNDSITSYYKYAENGKIEMTSTGNMNISEAFDLLRYKIKILRKQLEIERKAREDITEDYMALRKELKNWIEKSELINESFIMERDASMEKDDYIQLLEEKIKMYENLIQRHNEAYPQDALPKINDSDIIEFINN